MAQDVIKIFTQPWGSLQIGKREQGTTASLLREMVLPAESWLVSKQICFVDTSSPLT